jgi:hypothetical protein
MVLVRRGFVRRKASDYRYVRMAEILVGEVDFIQGLAINCYMKKIWIKLCFDDLCDSFVQSLRWHTGDSFLKVQQLPMKGGGLYRIL